MSHCGQVSAHLCICNPSYDHLHLEDAVHGSNICPYPRRGGGRGEHCEGRHLVFVATRRQSGAQ